jgi:hypothetical protein
MVDILGFGGLPYWPMMWPRRTRGRSLIAGGMLAQEAASGIKSRKKSRRQTIPCIPMATVCGALGIKRVCVPAILGGMGHGNDAHCPLDWKSRALSHLRCNRRMGLMQKSGS